MAEMSDDPPEEDSTGSPRATVVHNRTGWWTARDETLEVTVQGTSREDALENLADLVAALDEAEMEAGDGSGGSE